MAKYIKDVFNDYIENNNLLDAEIENINLYQKSNKLQISVISSKQIELADIDNFEKYLIKRFKVTKASIDIKYNNIQIEPNIEENWINIVNYIAKKEPFSRAVLNRSHVEITDNEIIVKLATKGADFLLSKKFDKGLEHLFLNLYNKNYKVTFVEEIDENEKAKFEESLRKQEDEYVKKLQEEYERQKQEQSNDLKSLEKEMEMQLNSGKLIQSDSQSSEEEEDTPLIYGRSMNIRSDLTKIADISVDTDKVCLDGEIVRIGELKELRNNNEKMIFDFDLYDGTSTMTCKVFFKKEEAKKCVQRLKDAKGIKLDGVAKYSPYDKEIGIIANTIIETPGTKKQKRIDNS